MVHFIDKTALVAEIKRLISNGQTKLKESEECNDYESYVALAERIATCINVLSFIDTLEVKEVDLEKELKRLIGNVGQCDRKLAKHFYELGMCASNPITAADRGTAEEIVLRKITALTSQKKLNG